MQVLRAHAYQAFRSVVADVGALVALIAHFFDAPEALVGAVRAVLNVVAEFVNRNAFRVVVALSGRVFAFEGVG